MRRILAALAAATLLAAVASTAAWAGNGPPHIGFYANDAVYRTIGTPTDFSNTGAPDSSFEPIFVFPNQMNVALAAPGQDGFKGGRWQAYPVTWNVTPYLITNGPDVLAAAAAGDLTISPTAAATFECPVIPVPANQR
jgi:hypothetical protein